MTATTTEPRGVAVLSRRGEERLRTGHPWIFRSDVKRAEAGPGVVVRVEGDRGRTLGYALHSERSEIRLRMLEWGELLPESWLADRLDAAVRWREAIAPGVATCRLVHAEADRLPSLVVDRYGDFVVVQTLSQGMDALKETVVGWLVRRLKPAGVLERNDPKVRQLEGLERKVGLLHGEVPALVEVEEDGLALQADLWKGQKTGLFLDQRENHALARLYGRGRGLDAFSYNGGFALQAARSCSSVVALDQSAEAVARIQTNAARNKLANVEAREANVFDALKEMDRAGERFDTVVLDPPAFAKSRSAVEPALRGYKEINLRALRMLNTGGVLITCSCSAHVDEWTLEQVLAEAAADAGVNAAIVEKRRQARDHPVLLAAPETRYLKCFVVRRLN
jgi:23S rRNA (cytosine1962-C5)-methyltransferase